MKREILYKAIRLDNGEWVEGSVTIDCNGNATIWHPLKTPLGGFQRFDVDPDTICQYSGRKDKHGNRVFQGDTFSEDSGNGMEEWAVSYDGRWWTIENGLGEYFDYFTEVEIELSEVTGNINNKQTK